MASGRGRAAGSIITTSTICRSHSQHDCEVDKQRVILHAQNSSAMNDTYSLRLYYWMMLQCVPSDDPRMKEK